MVRALDHPPMTVGDHRTVIEEEWAAIPQNTINMPNIIIFDDKRGYDVRDVYHLDNSEITQNL